MQRVSSFLPSWDKRSSGTSTKSGGLFGWSHRATASNASNTASTGLNSRLSLANGNKNANSLARINIAAANSSGGRVQREAYWPTTLDLECDKAARILKSFCSDGYLVPLQLEAATPSDDEEPHTPVKITKKIPKRIIQNAAGIAIFTCMRNGLWMTGSGGSGILIARKSDGTWSPPSGIMLHTPALSFIIGVDVYDCVLVVNDVAALERISRPRVILGEDVELSEGPSVPLDFDEQELNLRDLSINVLTYMKARGQHQLVNLNNCLLTERANENERFYSSNVTQMDILAGNVARHVEETKPLFEVIKMAEGRTDFDQEVIDKTAVQPAPGDATIATPRSTPASPRPAFGIPQANDPDPFGLLALEMAGMEIREAGSQLRPASNQFDMSHNPLSPSFSKFNRQSMETFTTKSNRGSYMSTRTVKSQMTDAGTQTSAGNTPETSPSPGQSDDGIERASINQMTEVKEEDEEVDYTTVDLTPLKHLSREHSVEALSVGEKAAVAEQDLNMLNTSTAGDDIERGSKASSNYEMDMRDDSDADEDDVDNMDADEDDDDDEEPVVFEVAAVQPARTQAVASRVIHARGNMVTIPKRIPPPLPMRSPARNSRLGKPDTTSDVANIASPLRQAFSEADLAVEDQRESEQDQGQPGEIKSSNGKSEIVPKAVEAQEAQTKQNTNEQRGKKDGASEEDDLETPIVEHAISQRLTLNIAGSEQARRDAKRRYSITDLPQVEQSVIDKTDTEAVDNNQLDSSKVEITIPNIHEEPVQIQTKDVQREDRVDDDKGSEETDLDNADNADIDTHETKLAKNGFTSARTQVLSIDESAADKSDEDAISVQPLHNEQIENSDTTSIKKHTSSIFTGATEDRWSFDRSSMTTPTSERASSVSDDAVSDGTPKKSLGEKETLELNISDPHAKDSITKLAETAKMA